MRIQQAYHHKAREHFVALCDSIVGFREVAPGFFVNPFVFYSVPRSSILKASAPGRRVRVGVKVFVFIEWMAGGSKDDYIRASAPKNCKATIAVETRSCRSPSSPEIVG